MKNYRRIFKSWKINIPSKIFVGDQNDIFFVKTKIWMEKQPSRNKSLTRHLGRCQQKMSCHTKKYVKSPNNRMFTTSFIRTLTYHALCPLFFFLCFSFSVFFFFYCLIEYTPTPLLICNHHSSIQICRTTGSVHTKLKLIIPFHFSILPFAFCFIGWYLFCQCFIGWLGNFHK